MRICAIDVHGEVNSERATSLPPAQKTRVGIEQAPIYWWDALIRLFEKIARDVNLIRVAALAIDGTSGSILLTDEAGEPIGPALMYNDNRAHKEAALLSKLAPLESGCHGPTSGLAKLLWLVNNTSTADVSHVLSQADWVSGKLTGQYDVSDENNCLKLGYDPIHRRWPAWIKGLNLNARWFPKVYRAGYPVGYITPPLAKQFGFSPHTQVMTGTTDSIAGFIATGASRLGDAVTSLGSTLVLKIIAAQPLFSPRYGVYSHRLRDLWLVGGASNSGGMVLKQFFSEAELTTMTSMLNPERPTGLNYYPLPSRGERFPIADPRLEPRLSPRPDDAVQFFQGILEGIADIERQGYRLLESIGAPYPTKVSTVGKGAKNIPWTAIRRERLGVKVISAVHADPAYGAALLARNGIISASDFSGSMTYQKNNEA